MKAILPIFTLFLGLSACTPAPEPAPAPVFDPNVDMTPGWNDKEPDTCHAQDYQALVGQPIAALHMAGIPRAYRVIGAGDIVSQEYNSQRIDAYIDPAGTIIKLSCG